MKKILLIFLWITICFNSYAQIMGIPTLIVGEQSIYCAIPQMGDIRYEWRVTGGISLVKTTPECATIKALKPGAGILSVSYYNMNGQMIDYQITNIVINPNPKAPTIIGPNKIRARGTYTYYLNSQQAISWEVNKDYFDIVSQDTKKITVKAKDKLGTTGIGALVKVDSDILTSHITIEIKNQEFKIENSKSTICNNEQMTYTLNGTEAGDIITWQPINNMTLVSGQGTSTPTFKGSGNGQGRVKAVISYDGKSYTVENSSVWVGPSGGIPNNTIDIDSKDLVGSLTFGEVAKSGVQYEWGGMFPPQFKGDKSRSSVIVDKKHIISQKGLNIWVKQTNSCGTVISYFVVTVGGQGGFPRD